MFLSLLFYFFSTILLTSSLMVIIVQNSTYSVLFLVLSFVSSTTMLFLLECEFLALLFLIIYVGAIAVLFLFVVMMLNLKTESLPKDSLKYYPFGSFIGIVFLFEMLSIVFNNFQNNIYPNSFLYNFHLNWYSKLDPVTEIIEVIGQTFYTHFVVQFLIVGLILFLAVIGAILLTFNFSRRKLKAQVTFKQLSRTYKSVLLY